MFTAIERESFDALLLNLGHSNACAEQAILGIKKIRPSLSERMVVVSRGNLNPQTLELIERYDLVHLPNERLFSQLWVTLESFFLNRRPQRGGAETLEPQDCCLTAFVYRRQPVYVRRQHRAGT